MLSIKVWDLLKHVSKCVTLIARLAIFLSIQVELLISHLEYVKTVRNLISSHVLIERSKLFEEKMKKENL